MRHQLLILYRHASAVADELRWCLRSLANVSGCNPEPLVVGDPPAWYIGPRLQLAPLRGRIADTRAKFRAIIESELVSDEFVLFADDNAVVAPIDYDYLSKPRSQPPRTSPPSMPHAWQQQRWDTIQFCREQGFAELDVSTHWPYCWSKAKLVATVDLIGDRPLLVETVYANQYSQATKPAELDFRYLNHSQGICEDAKVVRYNDFWFRRGVRNQLQTLFPNPCPWETGSVLSMPAPGVIDHGSMYACDSLGKVIRVEGPTVVFKCEKFGEAVLFGTAKHVCERCERYRMTQKVVTIGGRNSGYTIAGRGNCNRRAGNVSIARQQV